MKHWSNKKTLTIGLLIIGACLLVAAAYMVMNRSTKREATQAEMDAYAPYAVDWQAVGEGTDKEIILSFCTAGENQTIGENEYQIFTSEDLGSHLYNFGEMMEIAQLEDVLYVQYTTPEGNMVTLGYSDAGLMEKAVYDLKADTLFYEIDGTVEVWEKFRNGVQWGA